MLVRKSKNNLVIFFNISEELVSYSFKKISIELSNLDK